MPNVICYRLAITSTGLPCHFYHRQSSWSPKLPFEIQKHLPNQHKQNESFGRIFEFFFRWGEKHENKHPGRSVLFSPSGALVCVFLGRKKNLYRCCGAATIYSTDPMCMCMCERTRFFQIFMTYCSLHYRFERDAKMQTRMVR